MPSFDIVSEVDLHELTNAVDQASRELTNRYDFKGTGASIQLNDKTTVLTADSDFQVRQMHSVLFDKMSKRGIDVACLEMGSIETRGQNSVQSCEVKTGIEKELSKKIVKIIKESKLKVQAAIQDEKVRVTGKKRDDLQQVMALVKGSEIDLPLQYQNFRD